MFLFPFLPHHPPHVPLPFSFSPPLPQHFPFAALVVSFASFSFSFVLSFSSVFVLLSVITSPLLLVCIIFRCIIYWSLFMVFDKYCIIIMIRQFEKSHLFFRLILFPLRFFFVFMLVFAFSRALGVGVCRHAHLNELENIPFFFVATWTFMCTNPAPESE
uniref:Uncharacterized protein n=1 Tax=Cacopsylla melanoneura TaxID=428564 RepID=A0A8D8RVQ4_9HEMI